jgi:hypothetical protein
MRLVKLPRVFGTGSVWVNPDLVLAVFPEEIEGRSFISNSGEGGDFIVALPADEVVRLLTEVGEA